MPFIRYQTEKFSDTHLAVVQFANGILDDYASQGYTLTLRQLYYQFVARDLFPDTWVDDTTGSKNSQKNYKKLGDIMVRARLSGLVDWNHLEDRTRSLASVSHWDAPGEIIASAAYSFRIDKWADQEYRPYVFVEKDALVGVVERICRQLDVSWFSCRGYASVSELWRIGQRMRDDYRFKQRPVVFHLGDHDPSGIDMTRDMRDRLCMFVGRPVDVTRIALNWNQVEELQPPPNPAKTTDSRYASYAAEFGEESWELDALDPTYITNLVSNSVAEIRDDDRFDALDARETTDRELLDQAAREWSTVVSHLNGG